MPFCNQNQTHCAVQTAQKQKQNKQKTNTNTVTSFSANTTLNIALCHKQIKANNNHLFVHIVTVTKSRSFSKILPLFCGLGHKTFFFFKWPENASPRDSDLVDPDVVPWGATVNQRTN